ncbi:hypothetical protein Tco_0365966 [Tanacetum coccineum]
MRALRLRISLFASNFATGCLETSAFALSSGVVNPKKGGLGIIAPLPIRFTSDANLLAGGVSKGNNCSFRHGPVASTVTNEVPCEKKLYVATNAGSKPIKSHPGPPESARIEHTHPVEQHTEDSDQLASGVPIFKI